ncbi:MAG: alanine--tRNA ligase [Gemmatimonadaceae bacterium]|nr:alanine--tRNA ligase [Gemmatimonadaceae bacterium]
MNSADIRRSFLAYFERQAHAVRPSSSLVPGDDPTLLFTNAGMVQFKRVFLGLESTGFGQRAVTSQKCVRAGGKHNDLEQVGHTARHHTFFEMLGNFSFGDYFKRDAIRFAWEFLTEDLGLEKEHLRVTVFNEDGEARALWREIAGLPDSRVYGLGAHDNFWQMADTGPCGPCSEIFVDLAHVAADWRFPEGASGEWTDLDRDEFSLAAFVEGVEAGRFLEIWNLVFMQFDRQPDGALNPLPKPSVDTGMGLDRVAAVLQRVTSNYHTDLFLPLIERIEETTGIPYRGRESDDSFLHSFAGTDGFGPRVTGLSAAAKGNQVLVEPAAFRVLADHARAVAFLLADGVFPSNEGRGFVLRRILRRAVRHAWLLGRATPTLVNVVQRVVETMGDVYPELRQRERHIVDTTLAEEQRFLATIDGGMHRFDELAPAGTTHGSEAFSGTIAGEDAFRLHDTFGFPIDLTELMARERGYTVDIPGFEAALAAQRSQSRQERKSKKLGIEVDEFTDGMWRTTTRDISVVVVGDNTTGENPAGNLTAGEVHDDGRDAQLTDLPVVGFAGYNKTELDTEVVAFRTLPDGRVAVMLRETPFYAEAGGQISDRGTITGDGWTVDVDEVRRIEGRVTAIGDANGKVSFGSVKAIVPRQARLDTERNHTATHLLHAALRTVLGEHVHQAGSLVAPDRLRFDFTHHGPMTDSQIAEVEDIVNRGVLEAIPLNIAERPYAEAVASGAMALFGEKYGDRVRVVNIPGVSAELCGGTHVGNTAEIALFRIVGETGVAAGVRRIEAVTGPRAHLLVRDRERALGEVENMLRATPGSALKRLQSVLDERRVLEKRLDDAMRSGGSTGARHLVDQGTLVEGVLVVAASVAAVDMSSLQALGDSLRENMNEGIAVLAASFGDGRSSLLCIVTDSIRERGLRADTIVKEVAAAVGGRGGGKPHMAVAGVPDASRIPDALAAVADVVRRQLTAASKPA